MKKIEVVVLQESAAITATETGTGVDVSKFHGNGHLVLNSSLTGGADQTSDVTIEHSDDNVTFTDSGVAFDQVTDAAGAFQSLYVSLDQFKRYVRAVNTLAGTSPAVTYGVIMAGELEGN